MKRFGRLVASVMETLPEEFKPYLDNVVVEVAAEPDEELLRRAGITDDDLEEDGTPLGLFDPLEVPWGSDAIDRNDMLHRLWVFRNPHEDEFPDPQLLRLEIRKTVIHELAHHFGYTERDLQRFEDVPDPFGDNWLPEAD